MVSYVHVYINILENTKPHEKDKRAKQYIYIGTYVYRRTHRELKDHVSSTVESLKAT